MSARKIANDLWLVEQKTARKTSYVGMIRLMDDWYTAILGGVVRKSFGTLEEAEKFFED